MSQKLPDCISTYFTVSNGADDALLEQCFTGTAEVRDEGETHVGIPTIRAWRRNAQSKYQYTLEPLEFSRQDNSVLVVTRVSGNFPGSPANLQQRFQLAGDKIQVLEIQ
ncbi:nuclear transport factor 2 family protein [Microbulbifer pacificus]|uniref:nuclear transport factor 2 family protein n=1 Tax=Microbulbifer pacificus TaxID=407164 RepID=UPI000CF42719|nr:nuclear transport factor 2 family protein [Microbulbifer pacificus]